MFKVERVKLNEKKLGFNFFLSWFVGFFYDYDGNKFFIMIFRLVMLL